jgi:hypothetical protein
MNIDQIKSLVRLILNAIAGGILAYTASKSQSAKDTAGFLAGFINGPDALAAAMLLVNWTWGHFTHAAVPNDTSGAGGSKTALILALMLPALCFTGCATAPTKAFKAVGATDITVVAAMGAWNDYVAQNHPPVSQELAVKAAFEKCQSAELLALDGTATAIPLTLTNGVTMKSIIVQAGSPSAASALADLVNLLTQFGVKL